MKNNLGRHNHPLMLMLLEDKVSSIYDGFYREDNMVVYGENSTCDLTWTVPDVVKKLLNYDGNMEVSFWWGDCEDIKITKVYVQYSKQK